MRNIIKIALLGAVTIGFNACGSSVDCDTTVIAGTNIAINVVCNNTDSIDNYIPLQTGDVIIKEEENTAITIYHNEDDQKVVCIDSGSASIARGVN